LTKALKDHVHKACPEQVDDPLLITCAVQAELQRSKRIIDQLEDDGSRPSTGEVADSSARPKPSLSRIVGSGNVILALLERGLSGRKSRHCALLWRLRMRILGMLGRRAEIKTVFYLALEQAPFAKVRFISRF
jgi:hypothetical protein